jgi:hypothetical protein
MNLARVNASSGSICSGRMDFVELVGRYKLDIGHQEGRLEPGSSDPVFDAHVGNADLVHQVAVLRDERMIVVSLLPKA